MLRFISTLFTSLALVAPVLFAGLLSLGLFTASPALAAVPKGWIRPSPASRFPKLRVRSKYFICDLAVTPSRAGLLSKYRGKQYWRVLTKAEKRRSPTADSKCRQLQLDLDRARSATTSSSNPAPASSSASSASSEGVNSCVITITSPLSGQQIEKNTALTLSLQVEHSGSCGGGEIFAVSNAPLHAPVHGSLLIAANSAVYQPHTNFTGQDSFVLSVVDVFGNSAQQQVSINIVPPPQCRDQLDNDEDGLVDFPADPDCGNQNAAESGATPRRTFAFTHWYYNYINPSNPGAGTIYPWQMEHPPLTGAHVIYPYVLAPDWGTMDPALAKRYVEQLPVGARSMFSWSVEFAGPNLGQGGFDLRDRCPGTTANCPWMDNWLSVVKPRVDQFFAEYKQLGGELDVYTADLEWLAFADRSIVAQNPRFSLPNANFPSNSILSRRMSEALGDNRILTNQGCGSNCDAYWNNFMMDWGIAYINAGIYDPMKAHFPAISASNFNFFHSDLPTYYTPSFSFVDQCTDGFYCSTGSHFGTSQQPGLSYHWGVPGEGTIYFDGENPLRNTTFNGLKFQSNWVKGAALAAPTVPVVPLIAGKQVYNGHTTVAPAQDYYAENVFHALLSGAPYLNYWTEIQYRPADDAPLNAAIDEFDRMAGAGARQTLFREDSDWMQGILRSSKAAWKFDYVLTCMQTGEERKLCRFSPEEFSAGGGLPALTVGSSLLSELDGAGNPEVVFRTRQKLIRFPGGKILRLSNSTSDRGFWVAMPRANTITTAPSGLNTLPSAELQVFQSPERNYEILVNAVSSFDPDGRIVRYSYDFNNDGVFDDAAVVGNAVIPDVNLNPYGNPRLIQYTFNPAYVAPEGVHQIGLRITDDRGGVTQVYSSAFTFFRAICPSSAGLFVGSATCPLASGASEP